MSDVPERAAEDPTLRALMAEYQAGSVEAFDRLHDVLAPDLRAYLTALARDAARADDLLQETFLQMHRARAAHAPGQPVRPWVFAIARRVFLMHQRSARRRSRHELSAAMGESGDRMATGDAQLHTRRVVTDALRQVPAAGRHAFVLHHLLGFSFQEIAARLGIRPGAAKIRSSRAASALRALLREERDE
jgi:RNA polymerase sigma-70 factor (ECF subfamily)